ncbi:MAG: hypothetical protein J7603_22260 [Pseudacidovorax sp.]|nr:hypothetical protein [Pseudacidovorax sp.]
MSGVQTSSPNAAIKFVVSSWPCTRQMPIANSIMESLTGRGMIDCIPSRTSHADEINVAPANAKIFNKRLI